MLHKKRILLLNPPGIRPFLRDYYCSTIAKGSYYWPPIDLLIQAAILKDSHTITVIDAIAEKLNSIQCSKKIKKISPHVIIFVTSTQSFEFDKAFLAPIKKEIPHIKLIGSGEIFLDDPILLLDKNSWLDAVLMKFISKGVLYYLDGNTDKIDYMVYRSNGKLVKKESQLPTHKKTFSIPSPPHELFPLHAYHMPGIKHHPFASVLTSFGCPYHCSFCNSGSFGFFVRPVDNVIKELLYVNRLGIKQIFFKDMTFGTDKQYLLNLLSKINEAGLKFSFNCYSRVDCINEEIIKRMKRSGCHLIQLGIESLDSSLMKKYGKGYSKNELLQCLTLIKKYHISVGLHFIFGLPGETKEGIYNSIQFAMQTKCLYASFNIFQNRAKAHINKNEKDAPSLSEEELKKIATHAAIKFYLYPRFWLYQIIQIRSIYELKNLFRNGLHLLLSTVRKL